MRRVAIVTLLIAALLTKVSVFPALAQQPEGPIRFVPTSPDGSVKVNGTYPPKPELCPARQPGSLHAAYRGVLEVGRRSSGQLYLVTELTFPEYLNGIAEVPRDWPLEALKAQVVAARTYAISHMNPSTALARELRYNLCSTDACQVYRGLNVERGAWGDQWSRAVAETAGEILRYDGEPAQTFYFSTSNGRTYSNADAFGGEPLPYLKSVPEEDDGQSPTSRWSVRMPLTDLAESLRLAEAWSAGPVTSVKQEGEQVTVSGEGDTRTMTISELRNRLNAQAVCLTPKRYPTMGPNGFPYPQVVPSKWATVRQEGPDAVIEGRGWGHGVGMVQWGLKGKADRGMGYADMLSFYYSGLRPETVDEPEQIRVSLATELESITIERNGPVRVEGASIPDGPVKITGGPTLSIAPGEPIAPRLRLETLTVSTPPPPGVAPSPPTILSFNLSAPANVFVEYRGPAHGRTPPEPRQRAAQTYSFDPAAAELPEGRYELALVANDGVDEVRAPGPFVDVAVAPPSPSPGSPTPDPSPSPAAQPRSGNPSPFFFIGLACLALAAIITGYLVFRSRTSAH